MLDVLSICSAVLVHTNGQVFSSFHDRGGFAEALTVIGERPPPFDPPTRPRGPAGRKAPACSATVRRKASSPRTPKGRDIRPDRLQPGVWDSQTDGSGDFPDL